MKVVAPFLLPGLKKKKSSWWQQCCGGSREPDYPVQSANQVIIHSHGGGFIAMTSRPHQSYIRQWALKTNTPILCVDYRLAPEDPFPAALDDMWQTYNWVLNHGEEILGIKPDKILLAGDSAGGNLVLGVLIRCIESGIRIPDGVLLAYPCLTLRNDGFSPSYLLALDDLILHHTFLKLCSEMYVGEWDRRDKYLSPLEVEEEVMSQFPPVRIVIGTEDPLHDDCWRLVERLQRLNRDVHMTVYSGLVHGGMNFYLRNNIKDGIRMVHQAASYLSTLLETTSL